MTFRSNDRTLGDVVFYVHVNGLVETTASVIRLLGEVLPREQLNSRIGFPVRKFRVETPKNAKSKSCRSARLGFMSRERLFYTCAHLCLFVCLFVCVCSRAR